MPLFISNRQYTVWVNESRRVNFDLNSPNEWIIQSEWNATNIQFYCPVENSFLSEYNMSRPFERFFNLYKTQNRKINPSFTALVQARGETTRISPLMIPLNIPITVHIGVLHFFPSGSQQAVENILHLDENEKKSSSINYQSDFLFHACSGYTHRAQYSQLHWPGDASVDWNIYSGGYVCEFYPDLTVQLVTRWLQVGTFSGFIHDETEGSTCTQERVQMFTNNQTEYIGRQYAKLRTQNFPYIYTLVHEAHATGLPITRHHLLTILQ
ncbi:unnamed protein product [Rotaria socialis]|uniref:Glycoside hydrolase family 31 TIM barrel domain-containing protein n=1 Tax=Rotaria socialis TaxID=392032 RepID=A0A820MNC2_9BILA|nr:unnamed protein product [Rotaria socialis]CAF4411496.1 unnamed protein product [Rotaria socialis]